MTEFTNTIRFRLSAAQVSVIWAGLDLLIRSNGSRLNIGGIRREYPFRIYPPPVGFDRGAFDQDYMNKITALWTRLRPKAKTGGRIQMDTIELRSAIFAIRANIDSIRRRRRNNQGSRPELRAKSHIDDESFGQLKIRSQRVVATLERHMRRANRTLLKSVGKDAYGALMDAWTKHVRWMSLHIAYFKALRPMIPGHRIQQQQILDDLMQMAEHGIRNAGYQPPGLRELRRIMRLFVRSAREVEKDHITFHTCCIMRNTSRQICTWANLSYAALHWSRCNDDHAPRGSEKEAHPRIRTR